MAGYKNYNQDGRSSEDRALDKFAEMMIEKVKSFNGDWKKPWFTEGALSWPKNLSGREYNGLNALMLMMHCEKEGYKLPIFLTFDRVAGLNYQKEKDGTKKPLTDKDGNKLPLVSVNKGSKSFPVFITTFTCVNKDTKERIKYDDFKQMSEDEKKAFNVYPKLNVYNVFSVHQTNMQEARPELWQQLEAKYGQKPSEQKGETFTFDAVDQMIKDNEWICPIKPTYGDNAYYSISKNEIVIPEKKQFKDGESFYSNLFHEMGHSTGAENQLGRLKPASFGSDEYAREELVAELTAALVSQRYGITKHLKEDSASYLKCWLDSLKESPEYIKTTLFDVKKASSMINQHIDAVQLKIDQAKDLPVECEEAIGSFIKTVKDPAKLSSGDYMQLAEDLPKDTPLSKAYNEYENAEGEWYSSRNSLLHPDDIADLKLKAQVAQEKFFTLLKDSVDSYLKRYPDQSVGIKAKTMVNMPLKDLGEYNIPDWSLCYLENGDASGLSDEEVEMVDDFVKKFPNGYVMNINWDDYNEFDHYPAFGERNEQALTQFGESPYLATKTYKVQFLDPIEREEKVEEEVAKSVGRGR